MKSQKGITMISLILYVASFVAVTAVIAGITTFFYSNTQVMDMNVGANSAYNRLNLYMLNESKKPGAEIFAWKESDTLKEVSRLATPANATQKFVTFIDGNGKKNSIIYDSTNRVIYYNLIKLCDKVNAFQVAVEKTAGKDVLNIYVEIDGTAFRTKYVVGS